MSWASRPRIKRANRRRLRRMIEPVLEGAQSWGGDRGSRFARWLLQKPRRARWIRSKAGLRKWPSRSSRASCGSPRGRARHLRHPLPRGGGTFSETALCNSLREERAPATPSGVALNLGRPVALRRDSALERDGPGQPSRAILAHEAPSDDRHLLPRRLVRRRWRRARRRAPTRPRARRRRDRQHSARYAGERRTGHPSIRREAASPAAESPAPAARRRTQLTAAPTGGAGDESAAPGRIDRSAGRVAAAFRGGCRENPRRAPWIRPKGGLGKPPAPSSRAGRPPRRHRPRELWGVLPRACCTVSVTGLPDSLRAKQQSGVDCCVAWNAQLAALGDNVERIRARRRRRRRV
jgi:hypothetical protein